MSLNTFALNTTSPNGIGGAMSDPPAFNVYDVPHGIQVGFRATYDVPHGVRVVLFNVYDIPHGIRVHIGSINIPHGIRVGIVNGINVPHGVKVTFAEIDFQPPPPPGDPTPDEPPEVPPIYWRALRQRAGDIPEFLYRSYGVRLTLTVVGVATFNMTPYLKSWSIDQHRSAPAGASFTLLDRERSMRPFGGAFSEYLRADAWGIIAGVTTVKKYWTLTYRMGSSVEESPRLIHLTKGWELQDPPAEVPIKCTDYSELLLQNEDWDDFISKSGNVFTAKGLIRTILSRHGCGFSRLDFDDYDLPRFSAKGSTPLDWIKQLLWVRQCEWYWERDTFVARPRLGGTTYTVADIYHLESVGFDESAIDLRNQFTIRKVANVSNVLGEFEYWSPEVPGFVGGEQGVSFTPSRNCRIEIDDIVVGVLENIVWHGEAGPISTMPALGPYVGGIPAVRVVMTYRPGTPFPPGVKAHIKGRIIGEPSTSDYYPPGVEKAFSVTVNDTPSQNQYGLRKEPSPVEATYIPTKEVAQQAGNALVDEARRTLMVSHWTGVLFPAIMPSSVAYLTSTLAGIENVRFYIESVTKSGDADGAVMAIVASYDP